MIVTIVLLSLISIALSVGLYHSVKKNLAFLELLETTVEQIDVSVEELDYYYKRIDKKAKLELFSDDPTIKELVDDLKKSRQVVLQVSEILTGERATLNEENQ